MTSNYPGDHADRGSEPTVKGCPNCGKVIKTNDCLDHYLVDLPAPAGRCSTHPAYESDYCPACGTARVIGGTR